MKFYGMVGHNPAQFGTRPTIEFQYIFNLPRPAATATTTATA